MYIGIYNDILSDFYSLFASLGGAMSVWMGVSFIVLVEVVELVVDFVAAACKNNYPR